MSDMSLPQSVGPLGSVALARQIRLDALEMTSRAGSAHIGSAFSCTDILAVLYSGVLRHWPHVPKAEADRFVLSKGHAASAFYAALAGVGAIERNQLQHYGADNSSLAGHANCHASQAIDLSTGSLGQGLGVACGMALTIARQGRQGSNRRVYALLSDGELDEGSNWEAFLFAAHHRLHGLTAVIDYNNLQSLDTVANTLGLEPIVDKLIAFGWDVVELNGHDHPALHAALTARSDKPRAIVARTTKGKGVDFMENKVLWHYRPARDAEYASAREQLLAGGTP
jgi:transketolase